MSDTLFDLTGMRALVTGGSRGLGRAMVLAFAEHGADVIIASRKAENCQALAEEVERDFGRRAFAIPCNVSDWDQCDRLVETAYAEAGRIDVLVNNAGLSPVYPRAVDVTEALWDKVLNVNLRGPFRLCALVGSQMAAGDGGSIINISSVSAIRPTADVIPYAAAKAGLNALTEAFAHDLAPKVRVNAIQAGPFLTDVSAAWSPDLLDALTTTNDLRRGGQPAEVVGAALYFASAASSFATGSILRLDGGMR